MSKKIIHIFIVITFIACLFANKPVLQVMGQTSSSTLNCRFGITSPGDTGGINLTSLRLSAFLNWGPARPSTLPAGIDFIHVLRVGDRTASDGRTIYENTKDEVKDLVPIYPPGS